MTSLENALAEARAALRLYMPGSEDLNEDFSFAEPIDAPRPGNRYSSTTNTIGPRLPSPQRQESSNIQIPTSQSTVSLETSPLSGNWEWDEREDAQMAVDLSTAWPV